ncbi:hypothetical protein FLK61_35085 [Paenalkalicoccus suaedae]|uniref:Uncharacterized protein n=1 Tax=Paenalkalicoccus suaedae TaxID=2592382 RepID=A0A859FGW2_9BACI|nr:hypothetical protein [Paenalkalicoccus suaedae]QKS71894.1 hypothetical protein FLK61_35085 [Paenalkalicoccus suaedae]
MEDIIIRMNEIELRFNALSDRIELFQENISNNITWFYSLLGVFVALIGAVGIALYFLVNNAVKAGIEKGINKVETEAMEQINLMKESNREFKINLESYNKDFRSLIKSEFNSISKNNSQIGYMRGTSTVQDSTFKLVVPRNFSANRIILFQVFTRDGLRVNDSLYNFTEDGEGGLNIVLKNIKNSYVYWEVIFEY